MFPPIFTICLAAPAVTAFLGSSPMRMYPAGEAPQTVAKPYVTWQTVYGSPDNTLGDTAESDTWGAQINVWAADLDTARNVAKAIRNAIEADQTGYVVAFRGEDRDPTTKNYSYRFDAEWITQR
ncbi:MAG: DUF3168 domain-containing protein [Gammaproteobacteria bacterium]|nr:DUF3168 domain-containing protein [Gammaproteobacteria bacterium]